MNSFYKLQNVLDGVKYILKSEAHLEAKYECKLIQI